MRRWTNLVGLAQRPRPKVGSTPADVVFCDNKWRLLRYDAPPGVERTGAAVVMIPSLINRHYVLDLMPNKSLAQWLVEQGHDVFCIDWGTPGPEDRFLTFDDYTDRYLSRALRVVRRLTGTLPHVLGYCLGGTLAVIHAGVYPQRFRSLVALATPVAFSAGGQLARWSQTPSFDVGALAQATGNVPWQLLQGAFHLLRPTMNLAKAVTVVDRAWNDRYLDGFLAIETWANDNVSIPGAFYERYINGLYREDALLDGGFTLRGKAVRLARIVCPTRVVTFADDSIVPEACAAPLAAAVSSADVAHIAMRGSHIGGVTSSSARKGLWPQLSAFWRGVDAAQT